MSNTIIKGEVVFSCDGEDCDEYLETDTGDYRAANSVRTDAGWIAFKNTETDEWEHRCSGCKRPSRPEPHRHWQDRD
ncbi:hypothetical protein UFOVP1324_45 [uncultured Caudovirales phage]|uniref:Uncharacterized protein n=1 Tax=uncultured Caudovirales phage TaxID=2100421 RepID=A0A6J5RYZ1_9CAUD|nr:hypothetical protein UFOVP1324_45 [uncultured Caudovirales phage]